MLSMITTYGPVVSDRAPQERMAPTRGSKRVANVWAAVISTRKYVLSPVSCHA